MFTLIIPAAGKSKQKPYWSDFHPNGNLMIFEGIKGLDLELFDRIIITSPYPTVHKTLYNRQLYKTPQICLTAFEGSTLI